MEGLSRLLDGPLEGLFGGVHVLPFFTPIDGVDAGFDPIDHTTVDVRLGTWSDVSRLASGRELVVDLIVNHISSSSREFRDFVARGRDSEHSAMFLTREAVFSGEATAEQLAAIYRPRPGLPFTSHQMADGSEKVMWTTFTGEQVDLDVQAPATIAYYERILDQFAAAGVDAVRLDAVGYAVKRAGTSCFMTADTVAFIEDLAARCRRRDLEVLVEIHAPFRVQLAIAPHVDWVYDFALPPLVLHAISMGDALPLKRWLEIRPANSVNVLDTHDGIGVIDVGPGPDGDGLLNAGQIDELVEGIHLRSAGQSRLATGAAASNLDLYQVNCTFFDALGRDDLRYWLARAMQVFVPGIPQLYYIGLLAGSNDMERLAETGNGRDVNRHHYDEAEILLALRRPVVRDLMRLIRFRNSHPAFGGEFRVEAAPDHVVALAWRSGSDEAVLRVNLADCSFELVDTRGKDRRVVTVPEAV